MQTNKNTVTVDLPVTGYDYLHFLTNYCGLSYNMRRMMQNQRTMMHR
jgi:hypothetical protein